MTESHPERTNDASEDANEDICELEKMVPEELEAAISDLEPDKKRTVLEFALMRYEGPIPPSFMLREYEDILPGAADRIFSMAENQSEHRQEIETIVLRRKSFSEVLGVVFAGLIALLAIGGGIFLIFTGNDGAGIVAILSALLSLAGVFVYGTKSERKEREAKHRQLDNE